MHGSSKLETRFQIIYTPQKKGLNTCSPYTLKLQQKKLWSHSWKGFYLYCILTKKCLGYLIKNSKLGQNVKKGHNLEQTGKRGKTLSRLFLFARTSFLNYLLATLKTHLLPDENIQSISISVLNFINNLIFCAYQHVAAVFRYCVNVLFSEMRYPCLNKCT